MPAVVLPEPVGPINRMFDFGDVVVLALVLEPLVMIVDGNRQHLPMNGYCEVASVQSLRRSSTARRPRACAKNGSPVHDCTTKPWNCHVKDGLEIRLHAMMCKGQIAGPMEACEALRQN